MITEKELLTAIAECESEPITGYKRSTLADLFIIYDHLFGQEQGYSYGSQPQRPVENVIEINGDTEFLNLVNGKNSDKVWAILDGFIEALQTLHPKMYQSILDEIRDI